MKPGSKSHETHVQVILTKETNVGVVSYLKNQPRPDKEDIVAFRQLRKKKWVEKERNKYQGKGCFCYYTMGFSVISKL